MVEAGTVVASASLGGDKGVQPMFGPRPLRNVEFAIMVLGVDENIDTVVGRSVRVPLQPAGVGRLKDGGGRLRGGVETPAATTGPVLSRQCPKSIRPCRRVHRAPGPGGPLRQGANLDEEGVPGSLLVGPEFREARDVPLVETSEHPWERERGEPAGSTGMDAGSLE